MPGHFFAWVVAEGIMFKIPINVPRTFYLNSKAPVTEEFPGRRVKKILPHGRPCFNLIEVNVMNNSCKVTKDTISFFFNVIGIQFLYLYLREHALTISFRL